jgi:hypothetical protein
MSRHQTRAGAYRLAASATTTTTRLLSTPTPPPGAMHRPRRVEVGHSRQPHTSARNRASAEAPAAVCVVSPSLLCSLFVVGCVVGGFVLVGWWWGWGRRPLLRAEAAPPSFWGVGCLVTCPPFGCRTRSPDRCGYLCGYLSTVHARIPPCRWGVVCWSSHGLHAAGVAARARVS